MLSRNYIKGTVQLHEAKDTIIKMQGFSNAEEIDPDRANSRTLLLQDDAPRFTSAPKKQSPFSMNGHASSSGYGSDSDGSLLFLEAGRPASTDQESAQGVS